MVNLIFAVLHSLAFSWWCRHMLTYDLIHQCLLLVLRSMRATNSLKSFLTFSPVLKNDPASAALRAASGMLDRLLE
ncbi:hypothetical protein HDV62DRAFT_346536 [Trichoderma sp. SZMC 28011]